ncbi:MAG: hypothetical protein IPJ97_08490 [Proteobacteria bacterium]|nr:hypothetical protein [Pseudomonadota bacterium]
MRRANVVSGVVLVVVGFMMLFVVIPWQIVPGPAEMMSPRLVPSLMIAVIVGLSVLLVIKNLQAGPDNADETESPPISRPRDCRDVQDWRRLRAGAGTVRVGFAANRRRRSGRWVAIGTRRAQRCNPSSDACGVSNGPLAAVFYKVLGTAIV